VLPDGQTFDVVANCEVDVKYDAVDEYYRLNVYETTVNIARACVQNNIKVFVHCGSAFDYEGLHKEPRAETAPLGAHSSLSKYRILVEKELQRMEGLRVVVLRLAALYGPLSTGSVVAALLVVYLVHRADFVLPVALDSGLPRHNVHTVDAAKAVLHLADWYTTNAKSGVEVFNVANLSSISKCLYAS
jgi:nucleoside-diphosphate-sugar epimerase